VTRLTVFYDARCGLCCAVRDWIARQDTFLPLACRPKPDDMDELVVVADSGEMWGGDTAWLMVLWALVDYRGWSYRLASPALLPAARTLFAQLSTYRGPLSCGLGLAPGGGEAMNVHAQ
jgi:predicted DCC family thiol-disulfide oxidoreductase YuxK